MSKIVFAYVGLFLALSVLGLGIAVMTTDILPNLFGTKRIVFVVLMLAYAAYRGFRVYTFFRDKDKGHV